MEYSNDIKYLIVDDHLLFGAGLKNLLLLVNPLAQIHYVDSLNGAKELLGRHQYHCLFLDVLLPQTQQEDLIKFIEHSKKKQSFMKVLIVSSMLHINIIKRFISKKIINGWISKNSGVSEIKEAVEKIGKGEIFLSQDLNRKITQNLLSGEKNDLTNKEMEVLSFIAQGLSVKRMADTLFLSPYTVLAHRRNIMRKLDLHSAPELVKYAYDNNLI